MFKKTALFWKDGFPKLLYQSHVKSHLLQIATKLDNSKLKKELKGNYYLKNCDHHFCIGIFLLPFFWLKTWGDVTYLQTCDDTSIKAPLRRQTICQICHKSAAFRFCRILLGIFHICGDIIFWIKKSMVCLILLMLFLAIDFFTISFQKVGDLV